MKSSIAVRLRISDRQKVPRDLYDYRIPENGAYYKAHSIGLLIRKVSDGYAANSLPIPPDLAELVESDWCSRRSEHCHDPAAEPPDLAEEASDTFTSVVAALAIPAADALATISKALGIDCQPCQKRHRIIKEMKKRGFAETLKLLKETLHGA